MGGTIVRILFVASPGIGHIFPTVSTAWALRAAGHDVLLATGGHHETAAHAGLPVVDTAPGVDFPQVFRGFFAEHGQPGVGGRSDGSVTKLFAQVSGKFVEHTVELARNWHPDLVIATLLQGAGPLAAAVSGVPWVLHGIGIVGSPELSQALAADMTGEYQRFGVEYEPPAAFLDVSPPSMRAADAADSAGWSMRYVPYNGGAVLEPWLLRPRSRARIAVTLGSVVPAMGGIASLRTFVAAAGEVAADFVLALGGNDISELGELPANVRPVDWIPLGSLLRACDAVIHHGGAGTTFTALDAGLPQLVLPHFADQPMNAEAVARAGVGAIVKPEELDVDRLAGLLTDDGTISAAKRVAAEIASQPTPSELVPKITSL
ncbi:MAG TPA: nucleotide disphospho-sugar-binding domain-containing protein [Pseudonocardiaceae bacterium]|nr:nucleotide disphospho-sugar-binding domain-containing protein [Pseudonocardiaceae bacterium]